MGWDRSELEALQDAQDLVEDGGDAAQRAGPIKKVSDRAQKVPEEVARPRLRIDVQHDLVEVDLQAEKIEVERAKRQVKDRARSGGCDRQAHSLCSRRHRTEGIRHGPGQ